MDKKFKSNLINKDTYVGLSPQTAKELAKEKLIPILETTLLNLLRDQSKLRRMAGRKNGTKLNC